MADGLNRVMLLGNVGADPELRSTKGGQSVMNLRLATNESFLDRNQEKQERTEWHTVVMWGKRAETLAKLVKKGHRLFVEGRIQTQTFEDKEGKERTKTEIVAVNVIWFSDGRGPGSRKSEPAPAMADADDDDIPF